MHCCYCTRHGAALAESGKLLCTQRLKRVQAVSAGIRPQLCRAQEAKLNALCTAALSLAQHK